MLATAQIPTNDNSLYSFFQNLGYQVNLIPFTASDWDLPERPTELINSIKLISDYNREFQIYHFNVNSLRRTDLRAILEPFYRRFPAGNYLFTFTSDYSELAFVSPQRISIPGQAQPKLQMRILNVDPHNVYHTDQEVLNAIQLSPSEQDADIIWQKHQQAFDVEKVTKAFFKTYKSMLQMLETEFVRQRQTSKEGQAFAQQLLNRLMFLYFIQKKGWLKWGGSRSDKRYIRNLWEKYKEHTKHTNRSDKFYSLWLNSLFFHAFKRSFGFRNFDLPDEVKASFSLMPFLNGGLFTENELDQTDFQVPDSFFQLIFDELLEKYNFTVREDTPLEVEVAVDPEMLGKVYESLILEQERHESGIFYTPRVEIEYMCRLSLIEYLSSSTNISKAVLIPFVMEPDQSMGIPIETLLKIRQALDQVRVVDLAVGSASFLVGMMNVLVGIHRAISDRIGERINEFALKKKIISQNLYGVDVMDWAVRVGELRLWLSLIIESDEREIDIYNHPLLPNLSFRLRQGDSLVEEIEGISFSLRSDFVYMPSEVKRQITALADKKAQFFRRESNSLMLKHDIERIELQLFQRVIDGKIKQLDYHLSQIRHQPGQERRVSEIESEKGRLLKIKSSLSNRPTKSFFTWDIDFVEIFDEKGGFDIVIGNPPYVRQEEIAPPLESKSDYDSEDKWRERKRAYKEQLERSVKAHWGNKVKIDRKSDLYVYFYYHGLALLRKGGVFCFINSNSWLDVGYGASLQEFLLKNIDILQIIDNQSQRSFAEADVNTVIVLLRRPNDGGSRLQRSDEIKFTALKKPFEEVISPINISSVDTATEVTRTDDFRVYPITHRKLFLDGVEVEEDSDEPELGFDNLELLRYAGGKWGGKYLRAPDIYFTILEKGRGKLVRLGDIAEVRRGFTTGANEFFYLDEEKIREWRIEKEFLKPVIKSPRECKSIIVKPEDLKFKIFMCHKDKSELRGTNALEYIKWGESQQFHERPTCRGRQRWWDVGAREVTPLCFNKGPWDRHFIPVNDIGAYTDQQVYVVFPHDDIDVEALKAVANCTMCGGFLETIGRSNEQIAFREIKNIFEEIHQPDRRALDEVVFDALGLTLGERDAVYEAVVELVRRRLERARSV